MQDTRMANEPERVASSMRKEVEMLMAELLGMQKVLDPKVQHVPIQKTESFIRAKSLI